MDDRNFGEKVGDAVAKFGSSWTFIFLAAFLLAIWIALNTLACFNTIAWDQYPYIFLNLFLSCVAAFQAPFIMMSQRRCEIKQDSAYRNLFKELKELVETDLALENSLLTLYIQQTKQLDELKEIVSQLKLSKKKQMGQAGLEPT